jgi:hypothetical protein
LFVDEVAEKDFLIRKHKLQCEMNYLQANCAHEKRLKFGWTKTTTRRPALAHALRLMMVLRGPRPM